MRLKTIAPIADYQGASRKVRFDDNGHCALLFGQHHTHLARIEQKLPVSIVARGNEVFIQGAGDDDVRAAANVLDDLYAQLAMGRMIGKDEVDAAIRMVASGTEAPPGGFRGQETLVKTERKLVAPRTVNQGAYLKSLARNELVFGLGPAGTGKTYLAVAHAISLLRERKVERVVLSRPAVEAGERLGFLPGDMKEKIDPYLRPLYDALQDMLPDGKLQSRIEIGQIEIAPLAFMRGRTLANACVILDEAQNTTQAQMKMFLTRLGENSRMIITGDTSQTDLPPGIVSGLRDAVSRLHGIDGIGIVEFDRSDIVRHPLVMEIIRAYDEPQVANGADHAARTN